MKHGNMTIQGDAVMRPLPKASAWTEDLSTLVGGATTHITGVGFEPRWVFFTCAINSTAAGGVGMGVEGGTLGTSLKDRYYLGADTWTREAYPIHVLTAAGPTRETYGWIQSTDTDGFTILWANNSTSGTLTIGFVAFQ